MCGGFFRKEHAIATTNRLARNMRLRVKEHFKGNVCKDYNNGNRNTSDWYNINRKPMHQYRHPEQRNPKNSNAPQSSRRPVQRNSQYASVSQGSQRRKCWNCGELNHVAMNCRHGQPIMCNSCHALGHKAKFCNGH